MVVLLASSPFSNLQIDRKRPRSSESDQQLTSFFMANLTKRDMVVAISDDVGINQQQTFAVIQKTLEHITESLAQGDNVELRNFGVFEVRLTKARVGRNPNKPETDVVIPARATVKFKPGKIMRQRVLLRTDKLSKQNGAKTQK